MKYFKNIFTKQYWINSSKHFTNIKSITLMSVLMALLIILEGLSSFAPIIIFDRHISIAFIAWAVFATLFGPVPTTIVAGLVNILAFFIFPSGYPFYVGYVFTSMLMGFIMGIVLYDYKTTIIGIVIARLLIDIGIHVGIESFFMKDILEFNNNAFNTYIIAGIVKNLIMWPLEVFIIIMVFIPLLKVFKQKQLVGLENDGKIHFC